jgi:ubiquinone/menaquinone biosynthesis C-methylase UbiE
MNPSQPGNPAETYEQYFVPAMFLPWATILLRHAALKPRERVLDVACGTGIGSQALALHPVFEALMASVARHLALPLSAVSTPFAMSDAEELQALFTRQDSKR